MCTVGQMGFDGFVVGDWNGHGQVEGCSIPPVHSHLTVVLICLWPLIAEKLYKTPWRR